MVLLQRFHDRELNVGRRKRLAVVERHTAPQLEGHGLAIGGDNKALSEARLRLQIEVVLQQTIKNLSGDLADRAGRRDIGCEIWRLGLRDLHQRTTRLLGDSASASHQRHDGGQGYRVQRRSHERSP